jgi:hypothetical protein
VSVAVKSGATSPAAGAADTKRPVIIPRIISKLLVRLGLKDNLFSETTAVAYRAKLRWLEVVLRIMAFAWSP